jgi:hypothetical protein
MTRKLLILALAFAGCVLAQSYRYSSTTGDVSLSGAGTKFTIQQPSGSGGRQLRLESAVVYCSVACDVTQSQNGSAASTTAGTITALHPLGGPASAATTFTASNVGSGTAAGGILHVPAATTVVLDLSKLSLGGSGANYTVVIASITGVANITLFWSEQ